MSEPWKISLHGGHSGDFCDHGEDTLQSMIEAAVNRGFSTFGVTAHAPAGSNAKDQRFLYEEEVDAGRSVGELEARFSEYSQTSKHLVSEFENRLEVLRGAEIEVVPEDSFAERANTIKSEFELDYLVGSVHWVDDIPIDVDKTRFDLAVEKRGGLEQFLLRYYELVRLMLEQAKPEILGHLDLPRLFSDGAAEHDSEKVRSAIDAVLEAAAKAQTILDLNVSALRKGLSTPYCSPWIVERAIELGVPFCFGDDSHSVAQVGAFIDEGRDYLLANGVETITTLRRENGTITEKIIPLR